MCPIKKGNSNEEKDKIWAVFLACNNNLPHTISSEVRLFADYTAICISVTICRHFIYLKLLNFYDLKLEKSESWVGYEIHPLQKSSMSLKEMILSQLSTESVYSAKY